MMPHTSLHLLCMYIAALGVLILAAAVWYG